MNLKIVKEEQKITEKTIEKATKNTKKFSSFSEMIKYYTHNEYDVRIWSEEEVSCRIEEEIHSLCTSLKIKYEELPFKEIENIAFLKLGEVINIEENWQETFYILKGDIVDFILGSEQAYLLRNEY